MNKSGPVNKPMNFSYEHWHIEYIYLTNSYYIVLTFTIQTSKRWPRCISEYLAHSYLHIVQHSTQ